MKRLPVVITEPAVADIDSIANYVEEASGSQSVAIRYVERIRQRCRKIGDAPRGGRPRDDLMLGMRTVPFERSALICYAIEDGQVLITNIFHGGRDVEALFRDAGPDSDEA